MCKYPAASLLPWATAAILLLLGDSQDPGEMKQVNTELSLADSDNTELSLADSYNTAILQLVVALQVTFMPLQFSRLLIFIVSIPFRWDAIDEMIVIIMTGWRRYVLVKYATRGLVQGGSVAPLFNILYALAVATFMAIHLLRTAANILQVQGWETVSRGYTVSRLTRTR